MDASDDQNKLTPGQEERAQSLAREGYTSEQIEVFRKAEWRVAQLFQLRTLLTRLSNSEEKLAKQWTQSGLSAQAVAEKLLARRQAHREFKAARKASQNKVPRPPE